MMKIAEGVTLVLLDTSFELESIIPALLWGFRKAYQPLWKVSDIKSEAASFFSGKKADVLYKGLTLNLE